MEGAKGHDGRSRRFCFRCCRRWRNGRSGRWPDSGRDGGCGYGDGFDTLNRILNGRWRGRFHGRWASARFTRRQNDRGKSLAAYRVLNAMGRVELRRHHPGISISVHVDNISNEYIELLERYPMPGRSVSLATNITF